MANQEIVNWTSVLSFLQKQQTQSSIREKEWNLQRHMLTDKINRLQAEIDSNRNIISNLMNRIKLLQIALLQQKSTQNQESKAQSTQEDLKKVESLLKKYQLQAKAKEEDHSKFLTTILSQIGIDSKQIISQPDIIHEQSNSIFRKQSALKFIETGSVNAHLDGVRKLFINEGKDFVITVSQDCLVKIWGYTNLTKNKFQHLEPARTHRQHTGPLFALAGSLSPFNPEQSIFFTGGSEGLIKYWKINNKNYSQSISPFATWNSVQQAQNGAAIWDLALINNKLLSSNSDGLIKLHEITETDRNNQKCQFKQKQFKSTCLSWLSSETFIQGCSNAPRAHIWDLNGKIRQKFLYQIDKGSQAESHQVNEICYAKNLKMVALGCEDGSLRLFSTNFSRMIRKINTGSSVSSVKLVKDWQLVCGTHSGSISAWDLRNYQKILQLQKCHMQKYDEGVFCLWTQNDKIVSGGADGVIKIYS